MTQHRLRSAPRLVRARAPLRLGLAGGGTDVSPYCDRYGGFVLNATIDKHAFATIEPSRDGRIRLVATDRDSSAEFRLAPQLAFDGHLDLHKGVYNWAVRTLNAGEPCPVTLSTFSDAPAGSGLGSSSTLVVAMVRAISEYLGAALDEYELAHAAFEIERCDVGLAGGRQDQYSAAFGGCNFMEFYAGDRVVVNPLRIKKDILFELEASLVLFFTGVSRESASIIAAQTSNIQRDDAGVIAAMHGLKEEAVVMKEALLKGNFDVFVGSMTRSWESKKRTASSISNSTINEVYDAALRNGARAGKVSGAGGGGFMMFFADPEKRMQLIRTLEAFGGNVLNCQFTRHGAESWTPRL
jgi:D-glycero-alpha-D-manno-heptose-7-phosphate kinase